jgi:tetratricopeptide (TPR) repeat protein
MTANYIYQRGLKKAANGKYRDAIHDFDRTLSMNSNILDVYYNRGLAYFRLGEFQDALNNFDKVLNASFGNGSTHLDLSLTILTYINRGFVYHQLNQLDRAIEDYNQALKLDFRCARAYRNRGLAYLALAKNQAALEDLQTAAQLFSDQGELSALQTTENLIEALLDEEDSEQPIR